MPNELPQKVERRDNVFCLPQDDLPASIHHIMNALTEVAIVLHNALMRGVGTLDDSRPPGQNSDGDQQVPMDIIADQLFYDARASQIYQTT